MRSLPFVFVAMFGACAGSPDGLRTPVVPLGEPAPAVDLTKDQGQRAAADRSPPVPVAEPGRGGDTSVSYRTVTQIVETPAVAPGEPTWSSGQGLPGNVGDPPASGEVQGYSPYYGSRQDREPWFPVGTLVGMGVGSAIGHHHGNQGEGAWIGASIGMLFDLHRVW